MRFKNAADIKYYLYHSRTKIESLFTQLAYSGTQTMSGELSGFGVRLAASRGDAPDDDDKLKAIVKELEDLGRVGTIEAPNEYIRGVTCMRWGMYMDSGRPSEEPPLVYFGAQVDGVVLGLGGSSRHVEGVYGSSGTSSRSVTPALVAHLVQGLGLPLKGWNAFCLSEGHEDVFEAMFLAAEHLKGPRQNVEFFAKILLDGRAWVPNSEDETLRFLLGTPLYVALAPPIPEDLSDY